MKLLFRFSSAIIFFSLTAAIPGASQDQTQAGTGNHSAIDLGRQSPIVQSAYRFLVGQAARIGDRQLREATIDAISNPETCIQHRANLTEADRNRILLDLAAAGLIDTKDDSFPGGVSAGVFPPVLNDGGSCPRLPQTFFSAPGSNFGGHHSYPGGLVLHETTNELADLRLASEYRQVYGHSAGGMATLNQDPLGDTAESQHTDIFIDQDIIIAAPIWHDWAKIIVFQWSADGTEFQELNFGGNGVTDNNGAGGNSKTPGHHILGLAEAMKRGLSQAFVITQASAHAAPTLGNEFKVVNWLRAAAIIARIDPFARGYLTKDAQGKPRLPALRRLGSLDLLPAQTNLLAEYTLHNLSDADFTYSVPAVASAQAILEKLAPSFGYDPADKATYNNGFRNPVLSLITAERLLMIYSERGLEGVQAELQKLKNKSVT
jgi:hypothetical protein